jgi:hypothetical protein
VSVIFSSVIGENLRTSVVSLCRSGEGLLFIIVVRDSLPGNAPFNRWVNLEFLNGISFCTLFDPLDLIVLKQFEAKNSDTFIVEDSVSAKGLLVYLRDSAPAKSRTVKLRTD